MNQKQFEQKHPGLKEKMMMEEATASAQLAGAKLKCEHCENLDEMEKEYPDGAYHGASLYCDECEAEYYEEYGGKMWACNEQAKFNHQELSKL